MSFKEFNVERLAGRTPPARLYLWTVDLTPPGINLADPSLLTMYARTCSLPGITNGEITIDYMNSQFYIAGKRTWDTFDVAFMENEKGDIYKVFYDWCNKIYNIEGFGEGGVPKDYKTRMDITRLDVKGNEIDQFIVIGAWPTTLGGIDFDYTSEDVQTITITFRFDYFTRNPKAATTQESGVPSFNLEVPGIGQI